MNDVLARLSVVLGMDTAAFSTGSSRAKKEVSGLERHVKRASGVVTAAVTTMLGAFAFDAIVQAGRAGLEYASSLAEVAAQLGVTTDALQEYRYAASQAGIEQNEMDQALSQLTRRLGDAAQGAKAPTAALELLGINVRDANGHVRAAGDVIPLIAEGLQKIESPAERAAVLVDLFGKSGQKLAPLLEGGAAGVNNLRDAAHELGIVLSADQIQKADDTADKLAAIKQVLEAKIAGAVSDNADSILALADALIKLVDAAGKAATAWRYFTKLDWSPGAGTFSQQFRRIQMEEMGPGVELTRGPTPLEAAQIARNRAAAALQRAPAPRVDARYLQASGGSPTRGRGSQAFSIAPRAPWPTAPRAIGSGAFGGRDMSQFMPGSGSSDWMRAATASASVAANTGKISDLMTRINIAVGGELVRGFMSAANGADELAGRAQSVLDRLYPNEAREREYAADLAALKARYGESAENAGRLADAQQRLKNEWIASLPAVDSISAGLSKYTRNAEAAAAKSEVVNVRVTKSFEDMASESLSALNQLANGVRNGGFLDILTSVLNIGLQLGQAGAFGKSAQSFLNQPIGANANGTSWWRGGLSVVGERGPELVNLPRGASVTPNNKLGSLGGGIAEIRPSPYFDVVVDGRVMRAAPSIAQAGAAGGVARVQRSGTRRVA